ncbi:MAG: glycosyltransferase [Acidimicrobiales bacterium]
MPSRPPVIMITPAHNEADHIGALVASVAAQTLQPEVWFVVDDASTDTTTETARTAAAACGIDQFVLVRREREDGRSFGAKARAVAAGWDVAREHPGDIVAIVDADVVLPDDYLETVAARFAADPTLGVTGGVYAHPVGSRVLLEVPPIHHVPGPTQTFRREVWEAIGGYRTLPNGGIDTAANIDARRAGWSTRCIPELVVQHSRRMGTGGGVRPVVAEFRKGRQDHDLANHPLFELGKLARRTVKPPYVVGALARLMGYGWAGLRRQRPVSDAFAAFVRAEQSARIRGYVTGGR